MASAAAVAAAGQAAEPEHTQSGSDAANDSTVSSHHSETLAGTGPKVAAPSPLGPSRQSPKRRLWQRDTKHSSRAPPTTAPAAHKDVEDTFTPEFIKIQQKLGRLANKKTLAL